MSRKAAILGLGARGVLWAGLFRDAGWRVSGFDPDPLANGLPRDSRGWRRETAISTTVAHADWVLCCVPDRLELVQKVLQRAQAEAPASAIIAVSTRLQDADAVQSCAIRPAQVIVISGDRVRDFGLNLTPRTTPEVKIAALATLSEICRLDTGAFDDTEVADQSLDARSA